MALSGLFIVIIVFILGGLAREGLWSNTITLFNTLFAAIIATCFFEPAADFLTANVMPSAVHIWDIMAAGAIFAVTYFLLRFITGKISKYHVRFHPLADSIGGPLVAAWIGWTAICFICFALHLAPLTRNFLDGGFDAEKELFFGLKPDRRWLGFMQLQSNKGGLGRNAVDKQGKVVSMFDPKSEFMVKYASRRSWLDEPKQAESILVK